MNKIINLSSKIELLNFQLPSSPLSLISLWIPAGSKHDPDKKEGLAHLFEHLFMAKTKDYPSQNLKMTDLEKKGIIFNAFSNKECAYFYQIQNKENFKQSFEILLDTLDNSIIDKKFLDHEKKVIIDEMNDAVNSDAESSWHLMMSDLFSDSSLGNNFLGTQQTIENISLKDVLDFRKNNYVRGKLLLVTINGDKNIIDLFPKPKHVQYSETIKIPGEKNIKFTARKNNNPHNAVRISFKTASIFKTDDNIALDFINNYLANHWMAKLVESMRTKSGLTYWVDGEIANFSNTGYISFYFTTSPENLDQAFSLFFNEINLLKQKPISAEALNAFKKYWQVIFSKELSNIKKYMEWIAYPACLGAKVISPKKYCSLMDKLTSEQIMAVAKKYLKKENLSVVILGKQTNATFSAIKINLDIY